MTRIKNWIFTYRNDIIDFILIFSAFLSIWSYLRLIPIIIFLINFFTFKRHMKVCFVFFTFAVGLYVFSYITNPLLESKFNEATRKGFHEEAKEESQTTLNILARHIDEYKKLHGYLPKTLKEVQRNSMIKDISYNLIEGSIEHPYYYFEIIDSNYYYLSGIGRDGLPKTKDDLIPEKDKYETLKLK